MEKRLLFIATAMCMLFVCTVTASKAQSSEPKTEIVGQFTLLRSETFRTRYEWKAGGGAVVAYDLNQTISLEAAFLAFGEGRIIRFGEALEIPQPELQGLFGVKAGVKREKYGVFAKLRPGFTRISAAQDCNGDSFASCRNEPKNTFTVDYGGVFEVYPARRFVVRVDAGAAYTRYPVRRVFIPSEPGSSIPFPGIFFNREGFARNRFQLSMGAGFRF